jgi:hypothetical protein
MKIKKNLCYFGLRIILLILFQLLGLENPKNPKIDSPYSVFGLFLVYLENIVKKHKTFRASVGNCSLIFICANKGDFRPKVSNKDSYLQRYSIKKIDSLLCRIEQSKLL